ncbi:hypothetical protein [Parendozoicomonas haliclonae]|uniref:Uncharacterized protein n=1 Tax=Parendozoicomonas haliclonae TaxID=1960125 RepID=A0A1X7AFR4_9GAMM|nr:hypothetical protein [Parendozoicomonas haliclonae]SMA38122.1 hypothetical protein EHSB41UT_00833 [Parendozoicomonas haliclonae]
MKKSGFGKIGQVAVIATTMTFAGGAMAWGWGNNDGEGRGHRDGRGYHQMQNGGCDMGGFHGAGMRGGMDRWQERLDRELTAEQVTTLAEARLIMHGNENIKVGEVKPTSDGYSVSIVTVKSGDLVDTLELAKNGLPLQMVERMEEREKYRQQRMGKNG